MKRVFKAIAGLAFGIFYGLLLLISGPIFVAYFSYKRNLWPWQI